MTIYVQRECGGYPNETGPDSGEIVGRRLSLELHEASQAEIDTFLKMFEEAFDLFISAGAVESDDLNEGPLCSDCLANVMANDGTATEVSHG